MTNATEGTPAFRISALMYWILSSSAVGVALLVSSPLLPDLWRLIVGVLGAVLTAAVARSQPNTPATTEPATPKAQGPGPARRPPIVRRHAGRYYILPMVLIVLSIIVCAIGISGVLGCLSLQHPQLAAAPSILANCPTGKVCSVDVPGQVVADCQQISNAHQVFYILSGIFGGTATAAAAVAPFVGDVPHGVDALSGVAAGSGALSLTFGLLGSWEADRFTRWCGGTSP